jgi:hypothetical protein
MRRTAGSAVAVGALAARCPARPRPNREPADLAESGIVANGGLAQDLGIRRSPRAPDRPRSARRRTRAAGRQIAVVPGAARRRQAPRSLSSARAVRPLGRADARPLAALLKPLATPMNDRYSDSLDLRGHSPHANARSAVASGLARVYRQASRAFSQNRRPHGPASSSTFTPRDERGHTDRVERAGGVGAALARLALPRLCGGPGRWRSPPLDCDSRAPGWRRPGVMSGIRRRPLEGGPAPRRYPWRAVPRGRRPSRRP